MGPNKHCLVHTTPGSKFSLKGRLCTKSRLIVQKESEAKIWRRGVILRVQLKSNHLKARLREVPRFALFRARSILKEGENGKTLS